MPTKYVILVATALLLAAPAAQAYAGFTHGVAYSMEVGHLIHPRSLAKAIGSCAHLFAKTLRKDEIRADGMAPPWLATSPDEHLMPLCTEAAQKLGLMPKPPLLSPSRVRALEEEARGAPR